MRESNKRPKGPLGLARIVAQHKMTESSERPFMAISLISFGTRHIRKGYINNLIKLVLKMCINKFHLLHLSKKPTCAIRHQTETGS